MTSLRLRVELLLASDENSGWTHLPKMEYQVPSNVSVEELTTELLQDSVQSGSSSVNIKPEQCLYLFLNGRIFGPQDASCTLQEIGAKDGMDVYLTSPYLSFEFGVQHTVLQLARPSKGKKFIVSPRLMGYKYMEDVEGWLSSSRVESYMKYRFRPAGYTDSPNDVKFTVARRLEKMQLCGPCLEVK